MDYDEGNCLAVYDSGGGSFQISWMSRSDIAPKRSEYEKRLEKVLKPNGLAPTLHDLLVLQNKDQQDTPNPVTFEIAMTLVGSLISKYIDPKDIEQLISKNYKTTFLSIGGINSHTRLAADVIKLLEAESMVSQPERELEEVMDSVIDSKHNDAPKLFSFTEASVIRALKRICDKKNEEL